MRPWCTQFRRASLFFVNHWSAAHPNAFGENVRLARSVRREDSQLSRKTPSRRAATAKAAPKAKTTSKRAASEEPTLLNRILKSLDDDKAEDIVTIDLEGRSSLTDALVIASGRSSRHVTSIAEHLARKLKEAGYGTRPVDGLQGGDWVLVDAGDVIVHIFRPEVRNYYDLEGMWSVEEPKRAAASQ
ncbi:MAG: ribosome silencing factor [Proteobacteria bacterium]|nr:ribosome silencing factor [Pseudomonadota bacterium]